MRAGEGHFAPDMKTVSFQAVPRDYPFYQIYAIGTDGRNEVALTDNEGMNWVPCWHPSEPCITWAGADHAAADVLPVFSLDGKRLMWTSTRTEYRSAQLFVGEFTLPR